jgi:hypothetical protein
MAFQLKDGSIILISNEDIKEIAHKIIIEAVGNGTVIMQQVRDTNAAKADTLIKLIASQSNMPADIKLKYLEEILNLLSTPGEKEIKTLMEEGGKVVAHPE